MTNVEFMVFETTGTSKEKQTNTLPLEEHVPDSSYPVRFPADSGAHLGLSQSAHMIQGLLP